MRLDLYGNELQPWHMAMSTTSAVHPATVLNPQLYEPKEPGGTPRKEPFAPSEPAQPPGTIGTRKHPGTPGTPGTPDSTPRVLPLCYAVETGYGLRKGLIL